MVQLRITGFGMTWVEGDYPITVLVATFVAILLSFVPLLRCIGRRMPEARVRRLRVDHLVFGVPGPLADAMESFEKLTGVAPTAGGTAP